MEIVGETWKPFNADENYLIDRNALNRIGEWERPYNNSANENLYWISSRGNYANSTGIRRPKCIMVKTTYGRNVSGPQIVYNGQTANYDVGNMIACAPECGLRPVFYIKDNVKIIDGEGTVSSPYEMSL